MLHHRHVNATTGSSAQANQYNMRLARREPQQSHTQESIALAVAPLHPSLLLLPLVRLFLLPLLLLLP